MTWLWPFGPGSGRATLLIDVRLPVRTDGRERHVVAPDHPSVADIGFADASGRRIAESAPRLADAAYHGVPFCEDRILHITSGPIRSIARIEVRETFVVDGALRAPIAFVGIGVTLMLGLAGRSAYGALLDRGAARLDTDRPFPNLHVSVRIPVRPFRFPVPRGSATPWQTPTASLAPPRTISCQDVDRVEIALSGNDFEETLRLAAS